MQAAAAAVNGGAHHPLAIPNISTYQGRQVFERNAKVVITGFSRGF